MTIIQCIDQVAQKFEPGVPVSSNDIFKRVQEQMPKISKTSFNMSLQRYEKQNPNFVRYQRGIYYKTVKTPFGDLGMNITELIKRTYMDKDGEIIGYESGPSYMNKIGLTTQMPAMLYIVTSKARYTEKDKKNNICLMKPVIEVNQENYRYLQLLDMIENKLNVKIEANCQQILRNQIKVHHLSFEKLLGYAKYYKNTKVLIGLSELAQEAL